MDELKLVNFKNYETLKVRFSPQLNCFVGMNGMGKTNLLESIYYLCMTKSNFGTNDRQMVRQGETFFRIEGHFSDKAKVVAKVIPGKQKQFERNDVTYGRLVEHIGQIPVVMIVPDDTKLVSEGSEERRRFIDNTLSQLESGYLKMLMAYNKVLKQRNAALKGMGKSGYYDDRLIQTYNDQLLEPADFIFKSRKKFISEFFPVFQRFYQIISDDAEQVSGAYVSKLENDTLKNLLAENEQKDRILMRTTVGIHRDDLKFTIGDNPLRKFGSQGQLKSFVLALKLAQFEFLKKQKNKKPLLLLDDIFDKLDRHRVAQLVGLLLDQDFGQIFITDTHENRLEKIVEQYGTNYRKFTVENGKII